LAQYPGLCFAITTGHFDYFHFICSKNMDVLRISEVCRAFPEGVMVSVDKVYGDLDVVEPLHLFNKKTLGSGRTFCLVINVATQNNKIYLMPQCRINHPPQSGITGLFDLFPQYRRHFAHGMEWAAQVQVGPM